MNDIEVHAKELLRRREWRGAAELFDDLLTTSLQKGTSKDLVVGYLLGRSECLFELGRHEAVVSDCQQVIKLLPDADGTSHNGSQAWKRLVHALYFLQRFNEAEAATREWLIVSGGSKNQPEAMKMLERLRVVFQMTNGHQKPPTNNILEDDLLSLDFSSWTGIAPPHQRKHPVELITESNTDANPNLHKNPLGLELNTIQGQDSTYPAPKAAKEGSAEPNSGLSCTYCCMTFNDRAELRSHCQSESHQRVIMSDEGRDWKWRPPPRGYTSDAYGLCDAWADMGVCRYSNQCVDAHGEAELAEWKERFEYRRMKLQRACQKELFGKSYTEQLHERWVSAPSPDRVMRERLDGVELACSGELTTSVADKRSTEQWVFTLTTDRALRHVALLQDATRNHYALKHVSCHDLSRNILHEWVPSNDQEWAVPSVPAFSTQECLCLEHKVTVAFATDIYGTFRQSLVFDLGGDPVLVKHMCVDVVPADHADKMKEMVKEITLAVVERWDQRNAHITAYAAPIFIVNHRVTRACCQCPRGQVRCHHMATALLAALEKFSKTDVACTWDKPKGVSNKGSETVTVNDMWPMTDGEVGFSLNRKPDANDYRWLHDHLKEIDPSLGIVWLLSDEPTPGT